MTNNLRELLGLAADHQPLFRRWFVMDTSREHPVVVEQCARKVEAEKLVTRLRELGAGASISIAEVEPIEYALVGWEKE